MRRRPPADRPEDPMPSGDTATASQGFPRPKAARTASELVIKTELTFCYRAELFLQLSVQFEF